MNLQKKRIIKSIPLFEIGICIVFLIVSFCIGDIPTKPTYKYINNHIVKNTWHDIYETVLAGVFLIISIISVLCIVIWIIQRIKRRKKIHKHIVSLFFSFVLCSLLLMISNIIVVGFWSDNDYSPICYKFSDDKHTIVIEERSFLLYGGGYVYQIYDDNDAVIIHTFSVDDGGRNKGHYDIKWYDNYAEITYNTFYTKDSKRTDKIVFAD